MSDVPLQAGALPHSPEATAVGEPPPCSCCGAVRAGGNAADLREALERIDRVGHRIKDWSQGGDGVAHSDNCSGCVAREALAVLEPAGEHGEDFEQQMYDERAASLHTEATQQENRSD